MLTKGPGSKWKRWVSAASELQGGFGEDIPSEHLTKVYLCQSGLLAAFVLPVNGGVPGCRL